MGNTLAERIQYAMDKCGMTQADLARATGIGTSNIAHIVSGRTKDPRISNALKIARALNVSLDYLAGSNEHPQAQVEIANPPGI